MKIKDALELIEEHKKPINPGYMVSFEVRVSGILRSDHFPDPHDGEPLIKTESKAWDLATEFSKVSTCNVNIYVTDQTFSPVKDYKERMLNKYPE